MLDGDYWKVFSLKIRNDITFLGMNGISKMEKQMYLAIYTFHYITYEILFYFSFEWNVIFCSDTFIAFLAYL